MINLLEECEVEIKTFSSLRIGQSFVTFANRKAVVWIKTKEFEPSEDEWTCADPTAVMVFGEFSAAIHDDTEVVPIDTARAITGEDR